jgi:IclR helix-turn-helix domain
VSVQIQSIERTAAAPRLLTGYPRPRALAELAAELQLRRGTAYGILRTLAVGATAVSRPIAHLQGGSPRAELVDYVMESAHRISRKLGGRRW